MAGPLFFLNDDAKLIDLIRNGDEEALAKIYQSNRKPIAAFVLRNNGTMDDAEDMLQEALVVLWERIRSGRFEYSAKLSTFLFATVKNMWMRRLARAKRETPMGNAGMDVVDGEESQLDSMITSDEARGVRNALDALGEPCRQLLLLFYWEELPMEKIAVTMGFANADTVKSKKYQCKKSLEKILREQMT
ncbi:MAG: RNA polymerase sigma factor [Bacteroidota bacterium]